MYRKLGQEISVSWLLLKMIIDTNLYKVFSVYEEYFLLISISIGILLCTSYISLVFIILLFISKGLRKLSFHVSEGQCRKRGTALHTEKFYNYANALGTQC